MKPGWCVSIDSRSFSKHAVIIIFERLAGKTRSNASSRKIKAQREYSLLAQSKMAPFKKRNTYIANLNIHS